MSGCSAALVITGTEVVTGRILDRNGPWLSRQLLEFGVDTKTIVIVGDRPKDILDALAEQQRHNVDLIITTGGLGPTADDKTMELVAEFTSQELVYNPQLHKNINQIIQKFGSRWSQTHRDALQIGAKKQAHVPAGAEILPPVGTAPGCLVSATEHTPVVLVLPGPPRELQPMWGAACESSVLQKVFQGSQGLSERKLRLFGLPESTLAATLREVESKAHEDFGKLEITTCLHRGEIEVVVRFEPELQETYEWFQTEVHSHHPRELFSYNGKSVDQQIAGLLDAKNQQSVVTAESCTSGLLAARLTEEAGASQRFHGGIVAYSNELKKHLLGVEQQLLDMHGAVSEPVVTAMAVGARERLQADFAVAVTGIAGPGGGDAEKPVGLVWFAVAGPTGVVTRKQLLTGQRDDVRERSTTVALHLLREVIAGPDSL